MLVTRIGAGNTKSNIKWIIPSLRSLEKKDKFVIRDGEERCKYSVFYFSTFKKFV